MSSPSVHPTPLASLFSAVHQNGPLIIRGEGVTITDVVCVARDGVHVTLTDEVEVRRRVDAWGVTNPSTLSSMRTGHYDARVCLSPATVQLYDAIQTVIDRPSSAPVPCIWNDNEQALDMYIAQIAADVASDGDIPQAVTEVVDHLGPCLAIQS